MFHTHHCPEYQILVSAVVGPDFETLLDDGRHLAWTIVVYNVEKSYVVNFGEKWLLFKKFLKPYIFTDNDLVVQHADTAINLCLCGFLRNSGIQYKLGRLILIRQNDTRRFN